MPDTRLFYIDGQWVPPVAARDHPVFDPATERPIATISLGGAADIDRAVAAARRAFPAYAATIPEERTRLLIRIVTAYNARGPEIAEAIRREMGAPAKLALRAQMPSGVEHFEVMIEALKTFGFSERILDSLVRYEPIGAVGMITPWNWPMNQVACKVAPALAAGCTMVLKPSELAPVSAHLFAEVLHEAGVPPGVFNLVNGLGPEVGARLAEHPDVDMISFTGSTRAGTDVARRAADTVKRVHQELGGKSPNILLDDAELGRAVTWSVRACFQNSGQSCNAPTRMLVPKHRLTEVEALAKAAADATVVGDPASERTHLGPVVSRAQWERIQRLIESGIAEGARVVAGGPGKPPGLDTGHFVRPTVFSGVSSAMTIAREEIFGPVLAILPYDTEEEAIAIANDTPYGLAACVWSKDPDRALEVAERLRVGSVQINGAPLDVRAPFGGYKRSGNGREWGVFGLREFLEVKAIMGDSVER
jgi:aldehyde dehydrogenase (NAD+)